MRLRQDLRERLANRLDRELHTWAQDERLFIETEKIFAPDATQIAVDVVSEERTPEEMPQRFVVTITDRERR